jgi:hypothetical protein
MRKTGLQKGDRSYEVEFLPWAEVVRAAHRNYEEYFNDPDDFEEAEAEKHVYDWDELESETREFDTIQAIFDFIRTEKPRYQITITERKYAPGFDRGTDGEPMHEWKVYPTRVQSVRDVWKAKFQVSA